MEQKLDFSLPDAKAKGSRQTAVVIVLLVVSVGVGVANLFFVSRRGAGEVAETRRGVSAEQVKELATKLANRSLYDRAAEVWRQYLESARLGDAERAKVLFQIGTLFEKAGSYARAIEYYYRSEAAAKLAELGPQINSHIKDCFERLGKFSALRYEMMARTSLKPTQQSGGKVVAEIGAEKITEADLDAMIEASIDDQMAQWSAFMTPQQLNEQKKRMLERFKSAQARQQFLRGRLAEEVLYREALSQELAEKDEVKKLIERQARQVLSQYLMNQQLAAKIHITEGDLQTYYAAHKEQYVEPARARISHIVVGEKQQAEKLLERLKAGEDFAELAKEFSEDKATAEKGGKIASAVTEGSYVAGIGNAAELNRAIFDANSGEVLARAFKSDKGWEVVRVDSKEPARQKEFEEVREQIMTALLNQKRQDVQQEYIRELSDKYDVVIHTSALTGGGENKAEEESQ